MLSIAICYAMDATEVMGRSVHCCHPNGKKVLKCTSDEHQIRWARVGLWRYRRLGGDDEGVIRNCTLLPSLVNLSPYHEPSTGALLFGWCFKCHFSAASRRAPPISGSGFVASRPVPNRVAAGSAE